MLEQQYFALMNYAAVQISNGFNLNQTVNRSYFHPRIEGSEYCPEIIGQRKITNSNPIYDSKQETVALEKQYISLMKHAKSMYRSLRKI
ncbi:hypothetical protein [Psychrobacillus sp. NPDC096623]|uniref:hypothetical protein n=1 Tax=Psychrobacillus sp. NPDC096623 TaxID=3364492 RepID=UPI00380F1F8C